MLRKGPLADGRPGRVYGGLTRPPVDPEDPRRIAAYDSLSIHEGVA